MSTLRIPVDLLPADGRFGAGPSKIVDGRLEALAATGHTLMGTSHRQPPVKALVRRIRAGLRTLFDVPEGYEVVLGNGGATAFWDVATHALIERRSQHVSCGEFTSKFAKAASAAPWLAEPSIIEATPGTLALPRAEAGIDAYAWAHNETSTGVMSPVLRVGEGLMLVDATSGAGGLPVDVAQADAYYFAPQKSFASDGGLWIALLSPAAIERAHQIKASGRHIPAFLDLVSAIDNSVKDQTLNTPAVATLFLMAEQLDAMNDQGALPGMVARTTASSTALYRWAESSAIATPYVADPAARSLVIGTIDFTAEVSADHLAATLRDNGVVDVESYRKLGRNQLRIGMYPAVDSADVEALTACIDWVAERL